MQKGRPKAKGPPDQLLRSESFLKPASLVSEVIVDSVARRCFLGTWCYCVDVATVAMYFLLLI